MDNLRSNHSCSLNVLSCCQKLDFCFHKVCKLYHRKIKDMEKSKMDVKTCFRK